MVIGLFSVQILHYFAGNCSLKRQLLDALWLPACFRLGGYFCSNVDCSISRLLGIGDFEN